MSENLLIGRSLATDRFREMLAGSLRERILRVTGAEKMGKSRLMREYRHIAEEEFRAQSALIDLRSQLQKKNQGDVLHIVCQQIGPTSFPQYRTVRDEISTQNTVQVRRVTQLFSRIVIRNESDKDVQENQRRRLTEAFLQDLKAMPSQLLILLLFDSIEQADTQVRVWVNEHLLLGLSRLLNVYTVIAGRHLPEPSAAWQDLSIDYELPPVNNTFAKM